MVYLPDVYNDDILFCIEDSNDMIKIKITNMNDRIPEIRRFALVSHRSLRKNLDYT